MAYVKLNNVNKPLAQNVTATKLCLREFETVAQQFLLKLLRGIF